MTTENTEIAPKTKPRTLKGLLSEDNVKNQFALALPKHLSADRFARVAITALTRTPKLQDCTPESFMRCLLDLSAMGLEPDGRRAHLILDYKGIAELVMRSGTVTSIHADKVCEQDQFVVNRGKIEQHVVDYKGARGNAYAFYVIVTFKDGSEKCEVMTRDEVEGIRKRSRAGNSGPWVSDFDEMAKKTVFRRASKWLPLSPEIQDAIRTDEDREFAQARNVTPTVRTEAINPFAPMLPAIEATTEEGGEA
jgi:recombination protein RecT